MNKLLLLFPLGLALGLAISSLYFVLKPETTIYDRLRDAKITYLQSPWDIELQQHPQSLYHFRTFEQFRDTVRNWTLGNVTVSLDTTYNVIFAGGQIFLVFYVYSEPD